MEKLIVEKRHVDLVLNHLINKKFLISRDKRWYYHNKEVSDLTLIGIKGVLVGKHDYSGVFTFQYQHESKIYTVLIPERESEIDHIFSKNEGL